MKRKQMTAFLLSAILTVSSCLSAGGIPVLASDAGGAAANDAVEETLQAGEEISAEEYTYASDAGILEGDEDDLTETGEDSLMESASAEGDEIRDEGMEQDPDALETDGEEYIPEYGDTSVPEGEDHSMPEGRDDFVSEDPSIDGSAEFPEEDQSAMTGEDAVSEDPSADESAELPEEDQPAMTGEDAVSEDPSADESAEFPEEDQPAMTGDGSGDLPGEISADEEDSAGVDAGQESSLPEADPDAVSETEEVFEDNTAENVSEDRKESIVERIGNLFDAGFDPEQAVSISAGDEIPVEMGEGKTIAFFRFVPEETGAYKFYTSGAIENCHALYDAEGERVTDYNYDYDWISDFSVNYHGLRGGSTYYFVIWSEYDFDEGEFCSFSLQLTLLTAPSYMKEAPALKAGDSVEVSVTAEDPQAYFSFVPEKTGKYRISADAGEDDYDDIGAAIYDSGGTYLRGSYDGEFDEYYYPNINHSGLSYVFEEGLTYYIEARAFPERSTVFTLNLIDVVPSAAMQEAQEIRPGDAVSVEFGPEDSSICFRFTPSEAGKYKLYTNGDIGIVLYDAYGEKIDSREFGNPLKYYDFKAGSTYYYQLYAEMPDPEDYTGCSFTVFLNEIAAPSYMRDADELVPDAPTDVSVTAEEPYKYFRITTEEDRLYMISAASDHGVDYQLYDHEGELIQGSDPYTEEGAPFSFRYSFYGGQTYYLGTGMWDSGAGNFTVTMAVPDTALYDSDAIPLPEDEPVAFQLDADHSSVYFRFIPEQDGKYDFHTSIDYAKVGDEFDDAVSFSLYESDGETRIWDSSLCEKEGKAVYSCSFKAGKKYYLRLWENFYYTGEEDPAQYTYTITAVKGTAPDYMKNAPELTAGEPFEVAVTPFDHYRYFRFVPQKDGVHRFYVSGDFYTGVELYDPDGERMGADSSGSDNGGTYLQCEFEKGKTYYFRAEVLDFYGFDEALLTARVDAGTSPYYLKDAQQLQTGDSADVALTGSTHRVWFKYICGQSGEYEFYTTTENEGDYVDLSAALYNDDLEQLDYELNYADDGNISLKSTFTEGEVCYLRISEYYDESYDLDTIFTLHLSGGQTDAWLKDYDCREENGRLVLKRYHGEGTEITVPGSAVFHGDTYDTIVLSPSMWPERVTSLSFEKGVVFPEDSSYLFAYITELTSIDLGNIDMSNVREVGSLFYNCRKLASIDLSKQNFSNVDYGYGLFNGCISLETIKTPVRVSAYLTLQKMYYDSEGRAYDYIPQNLTKSIVLTKQQESEWLSDFDYYVSGDAIWLERYLGSERDIVIPGSGEVGHKVYSTVRIYGSVWPYAVTSIRFEKGVVLPDYCNGLFSYLPDLASVDMGSVDGSNIFYADDMFSGSRNLETVCAPTHLSVEIGLNRAFMSEDGKLYTSLPENLTDSVRLTKAEASEWLEDYAYSIEDDTIVLKKSYSVNNEIVVPGIATIGTKDFNRVRPMASLWTSSNLDINIHTMTFGAGVVFPEDSSGILNFQSLQEVDLSGVDMSEVTKAENMFGGSLTKIRTPGNLKISIPLPFAFTDDSGTLYSSLQAGTASGQTLTKVDVSDNLSDYSYQIVGSRVKLLRYLGSDVDILVPGSVRVGDKQYNKVELTPGMWDDHRWTIEDLSFEEGVVLPADSSRLFSGLYNLSAIDLHNLDFSGVTNVSKLLQGCNRLKELDLSGLDFSAVTNTSGMLYECYGLESLNLSGLDFSKVTDMSEIFAGCMELSSFTPGNINTAAVRDMSGMFRCCYRLKTVDVSRFNTSNVTDMSGMFYSCENLTSLDLSHFNTEKVTDMSSMFGWCEKLASIRFNGWNTGNVRNMSEMFDNCASLETIDVSGFNTGNVSNMSYMFSDCALLSSLNIKGFNTSNVTEMASMFSYCRTLTDLDLSGFDTSKVTTMKAMFRECASLKTLDISGFTITSDKHVSKIFSGCKALLTIYAPAGVTKSVDLPAVYGGTDGYEYNKLPRNLTAGTVLIWEDEYRAVESGNPVASRNMENAKIVLSGTAFEYNGKARTPSVTVTLKGKTLTKNKDYTVTYKNNVYAGKATVTVTGKGMYLRSKSVSFTIKKTAQKLKATAKAAAVSVTKTTSITVTGAKGKVTYKSANTSVATVNSKGVVSAKKVGKVKITVTSAATANFNKAACTVTISVVPAATSKLTAQNLTKGIRLTWKKVTGATGYIIYRNNKAITTIKKGETVTYTDAKANTNGTKYTYKIVAKASTGNSKLSKSVSVLRVAVPTFSSVKNNEVKKAVVTWKKNDKASGYEIQYGLKSNFSDAKTVNVTGAKTVSRTLTGLSQGKTYYVRIRAYRKSGTLTSRSAWSAKKTVKITKTAKSKKSTK